VHRSEAVESSAFASLKQEQRSAKRQLIEVAAARVFAQKGYRHATVADVARAAGISAGTIYLYFASREDLLFATVLAEVDALEQRMRGQLDPSAPADQALRSLMKAYCEYALERPEGFRMVTAGLEREARLKADPQLVAEYNRRALGCLELLQEVIARGIEDGSFRAAEAWELTHAVWGACHGLLQVCLAQDPERFVGFEVTRLFDCTAEALLTGITTTGGDH
jgi:AcrR family transcriptional regulator